MTDSDDEYSFKPLGGSLHVRKASPAPAARPAYQSADDIANKYIKRAAPPQAAAATAAVTAAPVHSSPKFDMVRPTSSPMRAASPRLSSATPTASQSQSRALNTSELDESLDSLDPGAKASPSRAQQPGSRNNEDSSFTDSPFKPRQAEQQQQTQRPPHSQSPTAASPLRHSYLDPKQPGRMQRPPKDDGSPDSDEESAFAKQIKPLGSSLWNKAIDPPRRAQQEQDRSEAEERKSDVRMEPFTGSASPAAARQRSPSPRAASAAAASSPRSGGVASSSPTSGSPLDQSRTYAKLLERWEQDQAEIQHLRAEKAVRDRQAREQAQIQQQQQQTATADTQEQSAQPDLNPSATDSNDHSLHFSPASPSFLPSSIPASQFEAAPSPVPLHSLPSHHPYASEVGDVRMDELLSDHRRLRQRLRAAQHAIEALAADEDREATLGHALRGGSSGGGGGGSSSRRTTPGYTAAISIPVSSAPVALSLSQYAHLPPARAVLKLLNRLEREEESFLVERGQWKAERSNLTHQIQTLYTDLKHLTSLVQQAQQAEQFHRAREAEQDATLKRLRSDREEERRRWGEIERSLRAAALQERVRANEEIRALETGANRGGAGYKERYEAVVAVLRKYEAERNASGAAAAAAAAGTQKPQQSKLVEVLARDFDAERRDMLATLAAQESKFKELQAQVASADKQKDALVREARADLEREQARRIACEQQLLQMQHQLTRSMDDKLAQLNSYVDTERQAAQGMVQPTIEHAAAEIANQYARAQHEPPLYEPRSAAALRRSSLSSRTRRRGSVSARYVDSNDESSHSLSPVRRCDRPLDRSRTRRRASFATGAAQHILSLLPPNSNVRGEIELVLPHTDSDDSFASRAPVRDRHAEDGEYEEEERRYRTRGRPRYARSTSSSRHAAEVAQQHQYPPPSSLARPPPASGPPSSRVTGHSSSCVTRSRSHSRAREDRERERELAQREYELDQREHDLLALEHEIEAGRQVRQEVDRRVQFAAGGDEQYVRVPSEVRRSRSASRIASAGRTDAASARVGPNVNGHTGVTIRVMRQQPHAASSKLSVGTKAANTKHMVRQAYNAAYEQSAFERY